MSQSGIEWTDWSLNPVKGKCPVACPYCYAREMYDRFRWNPQVRFCPSVYNDLPKKPVRVFVGSTMELFLFDDWVEFILNRCQDFPQHTFIFLTKKPEKLPRWSPFPANAWVGVTVNNKDMLEVACSNALKIKARIIYLSIEPLLERLTPHVWLYTPFNWVIIGAMTGRKSKIMELAKQYPELTPMPWGSKWTLQPPIDWVEEIVRAADQTGIPVFLKPNLEPLLETLDITGTSFGRLTTGDIKVNREGYRKREWYRLRQEMPDNGNSR
ncbi:hypothetical protein ES703_108580 [subsurface metagenome]